MMEIRNNNNKIKLKTQQLWVHRKLNILHLSYKTKKTSGQNNTDYRTIISCQSAIKLYNHIIVIMMIIIVITNNNYM